MLVCLTQRSRQLIESLTRLLALVHSCTPVNEVSTTGLYTVLVRNVVKRSRNTPPAI